MKVRAPSADSRYFDVKKLIHGAQPAHDLRGGALPEHRRVLGPRHRDLPDPRRHVHARLPLLLRPLRQARAPAGPARAAAARADRGADGPEARRRHVGRPRRRARPRRRPLRGDDPRAQAQGARRRRSRCSRPTSSASRRRRSAPCSPRGRTSSTTTSRPFAACIARMRGAKATYDKALWLLARAKEVADYPVLTKSGIIVGLGETNDEVVETMRDLREHGVDVVTIGQYLQPLGEARDDRPLGAPRRVPLVPRAGRGARLRLGLLRAARPLELTAPTSSGTRPRPAAAPSRTSKRKGRPEERPPLVRLGRP